MKLRVQSDKPRKPSPPKAGAFDWSIEGRTERLEQLTNQGLPASKIAEIFGVSRNAVIGRCHRRGFKLKGKPELHLSEKVRKIKSGEIVLRRPPPKEVVIIVADNDAPYNLRLSDMGTQTCKYPTGEMLSGELLFCGHGSLEGSSWCAQHTKIVFQPAPKPQRAQIKTRRAS